jgi:hypothetical protein
MSNVHKMRLKQDVCVCTHYETLTTLTLVLIKIEFVEFDEKPWSSAGTSNTQPARGFNAALQQQLFKTRKYDFLSF